MREIETIQEMQQIEINIMQHIHDFCTLNDIKYFLAYGTLIGSIRHRGFVPWDDDMDIWMLREDYDRFCATFDDFGSQFHLRLLNSNTVPRYNRCMTKVINQDTLLTELSFVEGTEMGVFVDVWPLDGIPKRGIKRFIHRYRVEICNKVLFSIIKNPAILPWHKRVIHSIVKNFNPDPIVNHLNELVKKYSGTEDVYCYQDKYKVPYPMQYFSSTVTCKFSGHAFLAPREFDKILKLTYGDYMKLPPKEQQVVGHPANIYWK